MTRQQSIEVVQFLNAAFVGTSLEPESVAVWVAELERLPDAVSAREAARWCGHNLDRFPTLSKYLTAYRERVRMNTPPAPRVALPERTDVPAEARAMLNQLRANTTLRSLT